jgi:hypothetical protein
MLSTPFNFYTRIPHIPAALGTATIEKQEVLLYHNYLKCHRCFAGLDVQG